MLSSLFSHIYPPPSSVRGTNLISDSKVYFFFMALLLFCTSEHRSAEGAKVTALGHLGWTKFILSFSI